MKTKDKISGHIVRGSIPALFLVFAIVALCSAITLTNHPPKFPTPHNDRALITNEHESAASASVPAIRRKQTLTFADRVAYQRAIEEVYWRLRIWPKANAGPKPPLDKMMSQAQIEKKVEDYLRNSQALEDYWQRPITPDQLQAEMERIASHTNQPGVLRDLFGALGNDPFVIAECLARPVLAERLLTELYAHDERFHGELKRCAEAELRSHRSVKQMKQAGGMYTEMEWIKSDAAKDDSAPGAVAASLWGVDRNAPQPSGYSEGEQNAIRMNRSEWDQNVQKLATIFGNRDPFAAGAAPAQTTLLPRQKGTPMTQTKTDVLSPLQEDDDDYYAVAVTKNGKDRVKLAAVAWLKEPLQSWLAKAEAQAPVTMAIVSANYTLPVIASPSESVTSPDVCTDNWTAISTTNAPAARYNNTAVWTGSELIVWGGANGANVFNTGSKYNPSTDSWTAISTTNAPAARIGHTAVWSGSQMIVWGGQNSSDLNTGGRYNPSTDSWAATSTTNAPAAREDHTTVWTGTQMIVWGGCSGGCSNIFNTGGRYDPSTDSWTATSTTNVPGARSGNTAVWTGTKMIIWGGLGGPGYLNTGGRYDPSTDSWAATDLTTAPSGSAYHTAVWTGNQMIVWGGYDGSFYLNNGYKYDPATNSWTATSTTNAPSSRYFHAAVWTGSEMLVWGGYDGANYLNTGGRYNPSTDSWTATTTTNAPAARNAQPTVWTGSQMIVWGGYNGSYLNTGGRYCSQSGPTPTPTISGRAIVADFNGDGHPDWVLRNVSTSQTAILYLNNNVPIGGAFGPTLPADWGLRGAADFNRDGHPDYALVNSGTGRTAIWYLSGPTLIGAAYGPTLPSGWELEATADFNGDGYPDYVLYDAGTRKTLLAYLNNNVVVGAAFGPTLPAGWILVGVADFNGDGHPDYLLSISSTGQTVVAYLSGPTIIGAALGPTVPGGWTLVATADFNGDGKPDYLLYNPSTRQTAIWYLNNNVFVSTAYGPTVPAGWSFVAP